VTGSGALIRAGGYWPMGRAMFHYPSGLGPTLPPLFLQSNFGIVTACAIKLLARPDVLHLLYATLSADQLVPALTALRRLRSAHALASIVKIYNAAAFHAYSGATAAPGDRTLHVLAAVSGSAAWVRHVSPFVGDALREARCFRDVALLDAESQAQAPGLVQALASALAGVPTRFAVERALGLRGGLDDPDDAAGNGLLFVIPVVRASSEGVLEALDVLATLSRRHGTPINTTINLMSESAVEMVSSILFRRTPACTARAHRLKRALVAELRERGIPLMRLDIDSQADSTLFPDPGYRGLLRTLKRAFDPNHVLAPGRYIPRE